MFNGNFCYEVLAINPDSVKLHGVPGVFWLPHKVKGILSEAMLPGFQIHFLSPKSTRDKAHANFGFISGGLVSRPSANNQFIELNLSRTAIPLPASKAEVSLPWM